MTADKKQRIEVLDPAVAALIRGMEELQADTNLPRKQREKKARERAKIESRREARATYDLPPALRQAIKQLSEEERVPASQVVTLALARFLFDYQNDNISLYELKTPSRSPRYDWNLAVPSELLAAFSKKKRTRKTG